MKLKTWRRLDLALNVILGLVFILMLIVNCVFLVYIWKVQPWGLMLQIMIVLSILPVLWVGWIIYLWNKR